jgi:uncharacterized membrane protein HdeD (DUF308 family)
MNRTVLLTLSGVTMLLAGFVVLLSQNIGVDFSKIAVPILFTISGFFAVQFANANKHFSIAKNYHLIHGFGLIAFAIAIAFIPKSLSGFLMIVTFFIAVFGILELIFSFTVLNSKYKLRMNILLYRIVSGIINLIGAFILFITLLSNLNRGTLVTGILIVIGGLSFVIFSSKIKTINN